MDKKMNPFFPGIVISAVCLLLTAIFVFIVVATQMFSFKWIALLALVLFLALSGVYLATKSVKQKVRFILGCLLAFVMLFVESFGIFYISRGIDALDEITNPNAEYSEIGIYVRKDDKAQTLIDTKNYVFGVLGTLDRDITNHSIEKINDELGYKIATSNFLGITDQMTALITEKSVDAIIVNKSFLDLLTETEEHKDDLDKIREIHTLKIENKKSNEDDNQKNKEIFTIYISGIDCYGSVSKRSRSDVNIIATVNTKTGQVLLVSTPRDFYVPLSISNGIPDKLTHAGIYGVDVSKDTLALLYDTNIDYYFRVNFDGFEGIIDALGGITVYSEYTFTSEMFGVTFYKGENHLNGEKALFFSRERNSFSEGDRQRGKNQMAVIEAVLKKAMSPALLRNYTQVLDGVKGTFETNVSYETIASLVKKQLDEGTKWNFASYSVDGTGAYKKPYSLSTSAYVMVPDQSTVDHAKALIKQVKNGEVPTP